MKNNAWTKLVVIALGGIVLSITLLWGVTQLTGQNNMNRGYGYNSMYNQGSSNMNSSTNTPAPSMMDSDKSGE
jgi:hypothetical protein